MNIKITYYFLFLGIFDFRPIVAPFTRPVTFVESSGSQNTIRRQCVEITLRPDEIYEDTESFFVDLTLRAGVTGVIIDPPVTKVFILEDEGLFNGSCC